MCLAIIATPLLGSSRRFGPKRLSRETGLRVTRIATRNGPALHFAVTGPCSCDFLGPNSDLEAPVWALAPEHLEALGKAVSLLAQEAGRFTFVAFFLGSERERTVRHVTSAELLALIRQNKVGNNVVYHVR